MSSDEKDKWGTIFLDANRESSLSKLDAMQAASRQEQWNQKTQQDYLEKVRQKAVERAKSILGEAYTERQQILEEAEKEAARIRQEAKAAQNDAENIRTDTQNLRHAVQAELDNANHIRNSAQEEGFQAGLAAAQTELDNFRASMGASVAGVLQAIEGQCLRIFAGWRHELVHLIKVSVTKATGLAIDERYAQILENLVYEAVRHLDERRSVILRVHPDDESVVADLFAAAKERLPDLGQWQIEADASLELGGLVAESPSGSVDSRLELFRDMVDGILEHLALPESQLDAQGQAFVQKIVQLESEHIAEKSAIPSVQPPAQASNTELEAEHMAEHSAPEPSMGEQATEPDPLDMPEPPIIPDAAHHADILAQETLLAADNMAQDAAQNFVQSDANALDSMDPLDFIDPLDSVDSADSTDAAPIIPEAETQEAAPTAEKNPKAAQESAQEPTRQELEEELLPIPDPNAIVNSEA